MKEIYLYLFDYLFVLDDDDSGDRKLCLCKLLIFICHFLAREVSFY